MKKVSTHILARVIAPIICPPDDEWERLMKINWHDPDRLKDLICERIVPHFLGYDECSKEKIRDSMEYFLSLEDSILERTFSANQVPIEPEGVARNFYSIAYKEFFGVPPVSKVNQNDYVVDDSEEFSNSLYQRRDP